MVDVIPSGPECRRLIGQIAVGQGIAYACVVLFRLPLTASYHRQAEIMPLAAWALLLITFGFAFILTSGKHRRRLTGRLVAAAMLGLQVWFATTFAMTGALTAVGQYIPIAIVVLGEAVFIKGGE